MGAGISVMNAALPSNPIAAAREEVKAVEKRVQRKRTRQESSETLTQPIVEPKTLAQ